MLVPSYKNNLLVFQQLHLYILYIRLFFVPIFELFGDIIQFLITFFLFLFKLIQIEKQNNEDT